VGDLAFSKVTHLESDFTRALNPYRSDFFNKSREIAFFGRAREFTINKATMKL
jgi:hypothetical protein